MTLKSQQADRSLRALLRDTKHAPLALIVAEISRSKVSDLSLGNSLLKLQIVVPPKLLGRFRQAWVPRKGRQELCLLRMFPGPKNSGVQKILEVTSMGREESPNTSCPNRRAVR